jgi:hypothetical protein
VARKALGKILSRHCLEVPVATSLAEATGMIENDLE